MLTHKIGTMVTGLGVTFTFFGVLLLFDRGLLVVGNFGFLVGIFILFGAQQTVQFFLRAHISAVLLFFFGICCILSGWTFLGFVIEGLGFFNLFKCVPS